MKYSLKTVSGLYMFMSSILTSLSLKVRLHSNTKSCEKAERFYYSHVADQRNVEITNRLLKLQDLLDKEDLNKGEYVLVDYGRGHIYGVDYYLRHSVMRKMKNAVYLPTYNLIDSNRVTKYTYNGKSWERKPLI